MIISMLIIGTLSLVAFVLVEWRASRLPMMPRKSLTYAILRSFPPPPGGIF